MGLGDPNLPDINVTAAPPQPDIPTIGDFLSWVRTVGLQRSSRFIATINAPTGPSGFPKNFHQKDLTLACETVSMPNKTIGTRQLRINGLTEYRAATVNYSGGNGITLTFLVDQTWDVQRFFEHWMELCVNDSNREVGEYWDYASSLSIVFLAPSNGTTYNAFGVRDTGADYADTYKQSVLKRVKNIAAEEVGKVVTSVKNSYETSKQNILGKQLGLFNKVAGVFSPSPTGSELPADITTFGIKINEAFPTSMVVSQPSQNSGDLMRLTVTFTFKTYNVWDLEIPSTDPKSGFLNQAVNFLKTNISDFPTSKKALANTILSNL